MTIAISLNVNAGLVLAADSASAVATQTAGGQLGVIQIYNNAYKLFQVGDLPVGILTWGVGGIGKVSVEQIVCDFSPKHTLESPMEVGKVAQEFGEYIKTLYDSAFGAWPDKPPLGFMISGFSDGQTHGEEYRVQFPRGEVQRIRGGGETGFAWNGEIEAITRLEKGYGGKIADVFQEMGLTDEQKAKFPNAQPKHLEAQLFVPTMPLQDAVDLARFLVKTTIEFQRFTPGAPTCGGPIDVAVITRRDGFKWVSRKSIQ